MKAIRRMAKLFGAVALLLALGTLALVQFGQSRILFPGWSRGVHVVDYDRRRFRTVRLTTQDGQPGRLLYAPPAPGRPVILFFHGNGDSAGGGTIALRPFLTAGYGAVVPEYRGYDGLPGTPSERGLYHDARAARRWMASQGIGPARTIVMGYSMGTGVAAQSAMETAPRALVLVAPFASIAHAARMRYPWLPAQWLVTERFATIEKLAAIRAPVLLIHGETDRTVPAANARLLAEARPDARLIVLPGIGHEVVWNPSAQAAIGRWLADQSPAPSALPIPSKAAAPVRPASSAASSFFAG